MSTETEDRFAEWRGGMEARVSTLEATVRQEAWAMAKMDTDMSDLKIQFGKQDLLLKALSKTQGEHTATLRDHTVMLRDLRTGQHELRQDVTELRRGVTEVREGIRTIVDLIERIDDSEEPGRASHG
jgi:uncharacterized coiled-coil protein SlyX